MRLALATVGTAGDVRPFAALARALVARGHEVTAISWPVHRDLLSLPDVRFVDAGPHAEASVIAAAAARATAESNPKRQVAILRDFHLAAGEEHYRTLRELLPGHDAVVLHGIHALAHAAALDAGVRFATAVFDPVLLPTADAPPAGMPSLGPANRLGWWLLDRMLAAAGRPLERVLARAGSANRRVPLFRARSADLHLVACSPNLIAVPRDLGPTTHVTGAWIDPSPAGPLPAAVEAFLANGDAPIVVTFGSMRGADAGAVRDAIRVIAARRRVIVQDVAADELDGTRVLRLGPVDHRSLFPRAALVVHHGGAGTVHAACTAGAPSVVVPHVGDQRYWADRLHRLGVAPAPVLMSTLSSERLSASVLDAINNGELRQRAEAIGARMAAEDGIGRAAALIEETFGQSIS